MIRPLHQLRVPSQNRVKTIKRKTQFQSRCLIPLLGQQFSQDSRSSYPRKDSQDKDSINTEATEYSKSGSDDEGARQQDSAFDPGITDPQEEMDKAGEGTGEGTVSKHVLLSLVCSINIMQATSLEYTVMLYHPSSY